MSFERLMYVLYKSYIQGVVYYSYFELHLFYWTTKFLKISVLTQIEKGMCNENAISFWIDANNEKVLIGALQRPISSYFNTFHFYDVIDIIDIT